MTESESVALPFGDGPLLVAEDFVLSCLPHVLSTNVIIGQVSKDCNPFFEKNAFFCVVLLCLAVLSQKNKILLGKILFVDTTVTPFFKFRDSNILI